MLPSGMAVRAEEQTSGSGLSKGASQKESTMADPASIANWKKDLTDDDGNYDEKNVGRIWSDKTVTTDNLETESEGKKITVSSSGSDFLVALSALSSMSDKKMVSDQPLDIVLTLDVSGSMEDNLNENTSKLSALQTAVKNFIDKTDAVNQKITDASKKHKIALVKYAGKKSDVVGNTTYRSGNFTYNHTQILSDLTVDAVALKSKVDALKAAGCTAADYGMEYTEKIIKNTGRSNAKKIVIMFTDGEPNHFSGFDGKVANQAISNAKELKDAGAVIYTIGVFKGANPSDTKSAFNAYMHGISSNYPNAAGYQNLGVKTPESAYYKAATNAAELNQIFEQIAQDIRQTTSGVPTLLNREDGTKSGYVTFTDRLGDYMQVDGVRAVICGGEKFELKENGIISSGKTQIYRFAGKVSVNPLYPDASLEDLLIRVEQSESLKTGDLVSVRIPASLLPLIHFKVNEVNGVQTTTVKEASPISICYGVSLKKETGEKLSMPDADMRSYFSENLKDDQVAFYSNAYTKNAENGSTFCAFVPAKENGYYQKAGTETISKKENVTGTAKNVQSVTWTSKEEKDIQMALGNNGKMLTLCPGTLRIEKNAAIAEGFQGPKDAQTKEFRFKVRIPEAENGTFPAQRYQSGKETGNLIEITFADGTAEISLKDQEALCIYGLKARAAYSVQEVSLPGGYTLDEKSGETGTITANKTKNAVFRNVYKAAPVELASETFGVKKSFPNWKAFHGLSFDICFSSSQENAPFPEEIQVKRDGDVRYQIKTLTDDNVTDFGTITYTKPGSYHYQIKERIPDEKDRAGGVIYSRALYEVTVTVTDDGNGNLKAVSSMLQKKDDQGKDKEIAVADQIARIANKYETDSVTLEGAANLKVKKELTGREWAKEDTFTFTIGWDKENPEAAREVKLPEPVTVKNGVVSHFGDIVFKEPGVYKLVIKEKTGSIPGVTYADGICKVTVIVTDNLDGTLRAQAFPSGYQTEGAGVSITNDQVMVFTNTYKAKSVAASIFGKKILEGRALRESDRFEFQIEAKDGAPLPGKTTVSNDIDGNFSFQMAYTKPDTYHYTVREVKETSQPIPGISYNTKGYDVTVKVTDDGKGALHASVIYPEGDWVEIKNQYKADPVVPAAFENGICGTKQVRVSENNEYAMEGGEFTFVLEPNENNPENDPVKALPESARTVQNDANGNFRFGQTMRYTESGTYIYTIREKQGKENGMSYDGTPVRVTVTVKDDQNGKLIASVSYEKGKDKTEDISFVNGYHPDKILVTLSGMKKLAGKTLEEGMFQFRLKSVDGESEEETVTNGRDGSFQFAPFTYTHPGTYQYEVSEVATNAAGYTCDEHVYHVKIVVTDQDGILQATIYTDGTEGQHLKFYNSYKPHPATLEGKSALRARKQLDGRKLKAGEFAFELLDEKQNVVAKAYNQADGSVMFPAMTYEEAGTYVYTMREKTGNLGGVEYDLQAYSVTVEVTDQDGYLQAAVTYGQDGKRAEIPVFANRYHAAPTEVLLMATKILKGRTLQEKEFTFELKDKDGEILQTAKNDRFGVVAFDKMMLDQAGVYSYTINERKDAAPGITYDGQIYTCQITVKDNSEGALVADVETAPGTCIFTNVYKESKKPEPPQTPQKPENPKKPEKPVSLGTRPKTGDETQTDALFGILAGAAGIIGICLMRKRKKA